MSKQQNLPSEKETKILAAHQASSMQTQLAAKQTLPRKRPTFLFFGGEGAASIELQLVRNR